MPGLHHHVTDKAKNEIMALKSFGVTNEEIATYLEISVDTLNRHYQKELDIAQVRANAEVAAKLFKKATKDEDLTAIIFWLKTRARWRTEDNTQNLDQNEDLKREIKQIRANLDAKNRKDY